MRAWLMLAGAVAPLAISADALAGRLPERQAIAITDVTVVDVEGGRSLARKTVLIAGGRIVAIDASANASIPAGAQRIDGRGRFLIPGLVDMHVHLFNNATRRPPNDWAFPLFLANGVTGVREMRAEPAQMGDVNRWRKELGEGSLVAPRILAAGVAVRGSSPDDARRQVDVAADAGADFIKVYSGVPASHWQAIQASARARSLPVDGHVPAAVPLLDAALAGQRSSAHLMQAFEVCSSIEAKILRERRDVQGDSGALLEAQEPRVLAAFDPRACRRVSKALARSGLMHEPTLVIQRLKFDGRPSDDPRWALLRADERARWERFFASPAAQNQALEKRRLDVALRIVSAMHRAGVPMMAGTDSPMPNVYPGYSLHDELRLLVASGLSPLEALRAATLTPAEFLGSASESGSVAIGKRADLVLLDADPTKDIGNTQRIDAVMIDGRLLRRAALDELLATHHDIGG
ncbi:MAG: amidohydrolase family protein [Arenimonas sp.]